MTLPIAARPTAPGPAPYEPPAEPISDTEAFSRIAGLLGATEDTEEPAPAAKPTAKPAAEAGAETTDEPAVDPLDALLASLNGDAPAAETAEDPTPAEEPALPTIDPPNSWTKEERALWAEVPPATQEIISRRETQRNTEVRRVQNEAAEVRKAAETKTTELATLSATTAAKLAHFETLVAKSIQDDFANVDWKTLAAEEPAKYITLFQAYSERQNSLNAMAAERAKAETAARDAQAERYQAMLADQNTKLLAAVPAFADPTKRATLESGIATYLQSKGYDQRDIAAISDHRVLLVILDAMKANTLLASRAKAATRVAAAPPKAVLQPSAPAAPEESAKRRASEIKKGLARARNQADQVALLEALL